MNESVVYCCWVASFILIVRNYLQGRNTVGLLLCYWLQLSLNHLFGHIFFSLSSVSEQYIDQSRLGFEVTGYANIGFIFGILLNDFFVNNNNKPKKHEAQQTKHDLINKYKLMNKIGGYSFGFGVLFYLLSYTGIYEYVPSSTAIFSASTQVFLSGICLKWWSNMRLGYQQIAWSWAACVIVFPFFTVTAGGFIGYGVIGILVVACFLGPSIRYRWFWLFVSPFAIYFALSFWVTYAAARTEVRERVWGGESIESRFDILYEVLFNRWTWVDVDDPEQIISVMRLNQNVLIGESVVYIETGYGQFGYGETFEQAVVAMIPRIIWPGKPTFAGSGSLVTHYTGRQFAQGTSVGIGQVMELYVNFGRSAVFIGYIFIGLIITYVDRLAYSYLDSGQSNKFLYIYCLGQTLQNVIGNFAELLPSLIGVYILVYIIIAIAQSTDYKVATQTKR